MVNHSCYPGTQEKQGSSKVQGYCWLHEFEHGVCMRLLKNYKSISVNF